MADFRNWTRSSSTATIPEISPITSNHGNPIEQPNRSGASTQSILIGEGDSSGSHARTLVILTTAGLQPSKTCSNFISECFKNELDTSGINWKGY
ncbi:hypothetical protein KY285_026222 [Solanum tuberosum]|nr:hypothetical protein KY285_026222 [Solanum tuberosum]